METWREMKREGISRALRWRARVEAEGPAPIIRMGTFSVAIVVAVVALGLVRRKMRELRSVYGMCLVLGIDV